MSNQRENLLPIADISRRGFLSSTAAAAAGMSIVAGPFSSQSFADSGNPSHSVPVDKKLAADWTASLTQRGTPGLYEQENINLLGMPVGGVAAGQLYLTGDGSLHCWWIHNRHYNTGRRDNYQRPLSGHRLEQGFAVRIQPEQGDATVRTLDRKGFPNVGFVGQYPINRVLYRDDSLPVSIEMEAFSPFIPINTNDSILPATLMEFTIGNRSDGKVTVDLAGYLQNPVGLLTRQAGGVGRLRQRVIRDAKTTCIEYSGLPPETEDANRLERPAEVFADFEGDDYGDWTATGTALGKRPSAGKNGKQNPVTGFEGKQLVNTYLPNDSAKGTLLSPEFTVSRRFINFLVGGGQSSRGTYLRLLVEGKEVARSGGRNSEQLAWQSWDVREHAGKTARIEIVDSATGAWGHINVDTIEFADKKRLGVGDFVEESDFGTACLTLLDPSKDGDFGMADIEGELDIDTLFSRDDALADVTYSLEEVRTGALRTSVTLAPGESKTIRFALTWHFPIRRGGFLRTSQHGKEVIGKDNIGNFYATLFDSAKSVANYVHGNYDRLAGDTRLYHRTFYQESTLPWWFLERVGQTPSILATETVHLRANRRLWGWEGVGCCGGTCTHVWNYEQALSRLFPDLERSMREMQDFGVGLGPQGIISFRGDSYTVKARYAADGQVGTIMRAYREHLMSADDSFLKRNWPQIKKALNYSIERDENGDGLLEDRQHNTYDVDFYGANTLVGALYLGALRAGEEMATLMGDEAFAKRCREIFESGSRLSSERLYNGEYFVHDAPGDRGRLYGKGCLADQLFGQSLAHQTGLGYLYDKDQVKSAMAAVYKYNWTPDVEVYNKAHTPWRWYAREGEAGLFICTWPTSPRPGKAEMAYRNEVWNGVEYHAAAHMIYEGMANEGLAIVRGIHDRYNGVRQNPFNEVECGEHYARSMAAWGCLLAVCGYAYDGPRGALTFSPRIQQDAFRAFFTGAEGWGSLDQRETETDRTCRVELAWGKLRLEQLQVTGTGVSHPESVRVTLDGQPLKAESATLEGGLLTIALKSITLEAGQAIEVTMPL